MRKLKTFFSGLVILSTMLIPIAGDMIYVRGAQGVGHFRRLYDDLAGWQQRRETLAEHTRKAFQIDLAKAKEPPQGQSAYAPKIEADGIIIDRFYVETMPGYYLCGNLYASADEAVNGKPMPLVMLAQGHFNESWDNRDRFFRDFQHLAAAFAQRGFLVVTWDMIGRGDDRNGRDEEALLPHKDNYNTALQTWNSIKLLSYLLSERFTAESAYTVDARYVALTGASGGGTQTIHAALLDDRLTAAIPVVMVSAYSNGGCECENGLNAMRDGRFKTNNCERIAAFAPKPLLVISDGDDWTKRTPAVEYPYLQEVYSFYGAKEKVENFHDLHGRHDYSLIKRQHALDFLLRQWALPRNGVYGLPYIKDTYTLQSYEQLRTFSTASGLARPADALRSCAELYARIRVEVAS